MRLRRKYVCNKEIHKKVKLKTITSGHSRTSRAEKGIIMNEKEITEIENAAVTNFAEMLCDYVSGLDEGEGIGREDIIDHLYEYINWDKRFTREYEEGKENFKPF